VIYDKIEATSDPKCQVPSIIRSALPLMSLGNNSSIAAKIEEYSPPTLTPVKKPAY